MNDQNNPYAAPQAAVKDVGILIGGFEMATRSSRFLASLLDGLVMLGLLWAVSLLTPWNLFTAHEPTEMVGFGVMGIAMWTLVNGYLLVTRGQTVGKVALKIKVLRPDGSRASIGRLIGLRYVIPMGINLIPIVGSIFSLVNPLMIFRDSRRCLHDDLADTIVVKA